MQGLVQLRKAKGLTQFELAEAIGIDSNSISRYERGIIKPSIEIARKFANYFNVPVDELLNGPREHEFKVILKFAKSIDEVEEEMVRDQFSLTVTEDGFVGASGLAMLNSEQDLEDALKKIRLNLLEGFETKKRLEARKKEEGK